MESVLLNRPVKRVAAPEIFFITLLLAVMFFMRPHFVMAGEIQRDSAPNTHSPSLQSPHSQLQKKDGVVNGEDEAETSEDNAFSDLLGEEGAAPEPIEPEERPYGIFFEGELRSAVWYQTHEPNQWLTANRLDLEAERPFGDLMLAAKFRMDYENLENENHVEMEFPGIACGLSFQARSNGLSGCVCRQTNDLLGKRG